MGNTIPNYISAGDFIDLYHLTRLNGLKFVFSKLIRAKKNRALSKWDGFFRSSTDFWVIPEVQNQWNLKCTGDKETEYEKYISKKYFNGIKGLKLLSVGCGNSDHERAFYKSGCFGLVEGIDISEKQLALARLEAKADNCNAIVYRQADFETEIIDSNTYDIILFHSSLHHFKNVRYIISKKTFPILKDNGLLVIFEYTGPNRVQWTDHQLQKVNALLKQLPVDKRTWFHSAIPKKRVFRPGIIRMLMSDPTEAPDSESILAVIHEQFEILEEKKLGGNILHPLLKGIAHHFSDSSHEATKILIELFQEDDAFTLNSKSDFTFGVYRKRL